MNSNAILQIKVGNNPPMAYVALQSQPSTIIDTYVPPVDRLKGLNGARKYGKGDAPKNTRKSKKSSKTHKPRKNAYRPGSSGRVTPSSRRNTLTGNSVYNPNPLLGAYNFQSMSAPMVNDIHNMLRANTEAQVSAARPRVPRAARAARAPPVRRLQNQVVDLTNFNTPIRREISRAALRRNLVRAGEVGSSSRRLLF